jgi:hypothetical protein
MGTGSFPGVKLPGPDADPSPLLVLRSKNRVALDLYFVACKKFETYLPFYSVTLSFLLQRELA